MSVSKDIIDNFKESTRPRFWEKLNEKKVTFKVVTFKKDLLKERQWVIDAFESGIPPS